MLGKDGLTITSANHLANIAKEMYESLESKVESLKLSSRDYMIAVNGNVYRMKKNLTSQNWIPFPRILGRLACLNP